jgi:small-conductance mechanosensitive channel
MSAFADDSSSPGLSRRVALAIALAIIGALTFGITAHLANTTDISFLRDQRSRIFAAEVALFGALIVEALANVVLVLFHRADALQTGIAMRALVRLFAYMVLLVSVVSILASNPALAIGVGGVTGVLIAFSAQNLVGNAFAGVFLAVARPFRMGEEITVGGVTGRVTDIRVMHTRIDMGDRIALAPSNWILSQVIQRKARNRLPWEDMREKEDNPGARQ